MFLDLVGDLILLVVGVSIDDDIVVLFFFFLISVFEEECFEILVNVLSCCWDLLVERRFLIDFLFWFGNYK